MQSPLTHSDLDIWNEQKKLLNSRKLYKKTKDGKKIPKTPIKEGEIWWCKLGINIWNEIYGKGVEYTRPVLIIKKISGYSCIVIPATSEPKDGTWFYPIVIGETQSFLIFPQIRMISTARFEEKIEEIFPTELEKIKKSAGKFYGFL
jgi:mRNA-degrading endonuclease toxin of MazEF toxin-antitoxin module